MKKKAKIILVLALIIVGIIVMSAMIANAKDKPEESAQLQNSAAYNPLEIEDYNDFEEVQRKVQAANEMGKEIREMNVGKAGVLKRQAESRLFFDNIKSVLIIILMVLAIIILCKKFFKKPALPKKEADAPSETTEDAPKDETTPAEDENTVPTENENSEESAKADAVPQEKSETEPKGSSNEVSEFLDVLNGDKA